MDWSGLPHVSLLLLPIYLRKGTVVMTTQPEGGYDDIFDLGFVDHSVPIRVVHREDPVRGIHNWTRVTSPSVSTLLL